tara:strand:+ start:1072 stop:3723 length:2652 start_codon:yes stop_codon:yes gene_type:complete
MTQYIVRRNKKDDQIVFGGAARAIKMQPVGSVSAQMSSSGNANNLDLIQTDIGEDTGSEYKILFDIPFTQFRTRQYNGDRTALEAKVSYGTTTAAINGINLVTEFQTADNAVGNVGIGTTRGDNVILNFGEDNDLQIWHDGTDSNIADKGSGNLHITSQDFTTMYNPNKTIKRAVFGDYNVSFFYGNVEKFKTKSYGVSITGICSATSLQGDGSAITGITTSQIVGYSAGGGGGGIGTDGSVNTTGIITATSFTGSGANITGISTLNITNYGVGLGGGGGSIVGIDTTGTSTFNIVSATSYSGIAYTMISGVPTANVTVDEFGYYQQYENPGQGSATGGPRIYTSNPSVNNNPFYYGTQLAPGQEMRWTHVSGATGQNYSVGKWGGGLTFTPSDVFNISNWTRSLLFKRTKVEFGTGQYDSKGFIPSAGTDVDYTIATNSTELALVYNKYTNKLELHNITGTREIIAIASSPEDGNPVTISFGIGSTGNLPGITTVTEYDYPSTWYVGYGTASNTELSNPFNDSNKRDLHPVYWPQVLEPGYEYRFTSLSSSVVNHFYTLGIWGGDTDDVYGPRSYNHLNWDMCYSIGTDATQNVVNPSGADNYMDSGDDNASKNTTVATATSISFPKGEVLCLNYSPTDGKIRLINESQGYVAFGTSNNAFSNHQTIFMGGKNALVPAPTFAKRDQSWEMISYRYDTGENPGKDWNWREDGGARPFVNMTSTRDLLPGQKVQIRIPRQGSNHYYWIAGNGWQGPTGKTDDFTSTDHVDNGSDVYWRWDSGEDTNITDNWEYNTSNSKYDSGGGNWDPGNTYEHVVEYRYSTSDNKIRWFDVTPDNASAPERIATSTVSFSGNPIRFGIMSIQNDINTSGSYVDLSELTYLLI